MPSTVPPPCGRMAEMEAKMTWKGLLNRRKLSSGRRRLGQRKADVRRALSIRAGLIWRSAVGRWRLA
jgi:hypothetical protein